MNCRRAWVCLVTTVLVACGGSTASKTGSAADDHRDDSEATSTSEKTPAPPYTPDPSSTVEFVPTTVVARRQPSHAGCGEDAPFSDDDAFTLQVVGGSISDGAQFKSVAVDFEASVARDTPFALVVDPPGSYGQQEADSNEVHLTLYGTDVVNEAPIPTPIKTATVTVIDVAKADRAPVTARIQMLFESGAKFDATISGALESGKGLCGAQ